MNITKPWLKGAKLLLAAAVALVLGATNAIPGGSRVAESLGIAEARAQHTSDCPNTDCLGTQFCEYFSGAKCSLSPGRCSVANC